MVTYRTLLDAIESLIYIGTHHLPFKFGVKIATIRLAAQAALKKYEAAAVGLTEADLENLKDTDSKIEFEKVPASEMAAHQFRSNDLAALAWMIDMRR
jgi:hypothetical protein